MDDQVQANLNMVNKLIAEGEEQKRAAELAKRAALVQQGNKAQIIVSVDYTADSGNQYNGTVVFRRPGALDYMRIGAQKSALLQAFGIRPMVIAGPNGQPVESMAHVDDSILILASALATIKTVMVDCDDWFKDYENSYDTDLLIHIYQEYTKELLFFRINSGQKPAGNSEDGADATAMARP